MQSGQGYRVAVWRGGPGGIIPSQATPVAKNEDDILAELGRELLLHQLRHCAARTGGSVVHRHADGLLREGCTV